MEHADVLVIGAGFAGLSAAKKLKQAGLDVRVLEARDRVGGRCYTALNGFGEPVDLGAQWLGPTHTEARALAKAYKQPLVPTPEKGQSLLVAAGRRGTFRAGSMRLPGRPLELLDLMRAIARLERLAKKVLPERPWGAPYAHRHDGWTLEQWLDRSVKTRWARDTLSAALTTVLAVEPAQISFLHTLFYFASSGSLRFLLDSHGGAQQDMFSNGSQGLAEAMAADLGDRLRLNDPVVYVEQSAHHVIVRTQRNRYSARRVVVAVPPPVLREIAFDPWLPERMLEQIEAFTPGTALKCVASYDEPFWRKRGWSGQSLQSGGLFRATFDTSKRSAKGYTLVGFAFGEQSANIHALEEADQRAVLLSGFVELFGDEASHVRSLDFHTWSDDRWSHGGYASMLRPNGWIRCRPTRTERWGRIHWAGTEYSASFNGYIEGAIRSGYATATEVEELQAATMALRV